MTAVFNIFCKQSKLRQANDFWSQRSPPAVTADAATASAAWPWQVVEEILKWRADGEPEHPLMPIAVGETRIAFPRRSVKAGGDPTHNRPPDRSKLLIPGQPAGIHDVQLRINLSPVQNR